MSGLKRVESAGGIVLGPSGTVLVITNRTGSKTFPKGSLKDGERPEDGALREIAEESGLTQVEIRRELGVIVRPGYTAENAKTPTVEKHIHMFLCSTPESELKPRAADSQEARWIPRDRVAGELTHEAEARFFGAYRSELPAA